MQICGGVIIALCLGCLRCPPALLSYSHSRDDMHYSSLTHLGGHKAAQLCQLLHEKGEVVGYFMLVSANHVDMVSAFFSFLFANLCTFGQACDGHAVRLLHGLFSSCDTVFLSIPLFTDLCLQSLHTGVSASNRSK